MLALRFLIISLGFLLIWHIIVRVFHFPAYILPEPMAVFISFANNIALILSNTWPTVLETLLGLALGIGCGCVLALVMHLVPGLGAWLIPSMIISQAIPTFAIAPILVLWFGYGLMSKVITITLMLFFPVASALYYGLQRIPAQLLDLSKVMNAKRHLSLWHLQLPAARASLQNGIRIATVLAPMGAIISEWIGASQGLGFLMLNENARLEIDLMFACLIAIILFSLALYALMTLVLSKV